ncbi:MAG TPA: hypothetical protein VGG27_05480 [Magnetospirillaceae bacterium]|jgi:hypothetical protein
MQVIKAFVIGMGALILIGVAVLIYGWTHHWNKSGQAAPVVTNQAEPRAPMSDPSPAAAPYDMTVPPPEGTHFEQMAVVGDRALLRFSGPQGESIVVVDPRTGHVTGTIGVPASGK